MCRQCYPAVGFSMEELGVIQTEEQGNRESPWNSPLFSFTTYVTCSLPTTNSKVVVHSSFWFKKLTLGQTGPTQTSAAPLVVYYWINQLKLMMN